MDLNIKAAIFDLDGVITKTATLHAKAWKKMFDAYNKERRQRGEEPYEEFSIKEDYPVYLDGKPRYDGVKSFLKSRNIELPNGNPEDDPDEETICGLGNRKNDFFHQIINEEGVHLIDENIQKLKEWREMGMKTAIISSSKNCKPILEAANAEHFFDVRIDGVISAERNIKGKPAPDIFLAAAKELGVKPEQSLIVEDAISGVQAGKAGKFGLVIGIGDNGSKNALLANGADKVVKNLLELNMLNNKKSSLKLEAALPHIDKIKEELKEKQPIICLDYDGTLTPIVEDYTKATLSEEMRNILKDTARNIPVAIVSGRDISFIKGQVDLDELYYAGSHGFEIEGPDNYHYEVEEGQDLLPILDEAESALKENLKSVQGANIERKKYAIAIHYRKVADDDMDSFNERIDEIVDNYQKLKRTEGKKIVEIKPNIDWDKGRAVEVLADVLLKGDTEKLVFYLGDDVTDEDAFRVINNGYGIIVGKPEGETFANYYLEDVEEVEEFLKKLTN